MSLNEPATRKAMASSWLSVILIAYRGRRIS